ncbi:MAG: thioredoxin family protein [Armatimonadetes bacterium]|nr:thioredoxin family protein [Armatimonadota bacterium]
MRRQQTPIWAIIALAILIAASTTYAARNTRAKAKPAAVKMPIFLELGAVWCPACQAMKPVIDDLKKEYKGKVMFQYIDVDKDKAASRKYKVEAIPVQVFFDKNGKQVYSHVGVLSKNEIKKQFAKMGVKTGSK